MRRLWVLSLLGLTAMPALAQNAESEVMHRTTADGVEFGLWGNTELKPAPVLFVLAGRPVWVIIGDQDDRVSTDDAIAFARSVSKSSRDRNMAGGVELHVLPEPRGHTTPAGAAGQAANWILKTMQSP